MNLLPIGTLVIHDGPDREDWVGRVIDHSLDPQYTCVAWVTPEGDLLDDSAEPGHLHPARIVPPEALDAEPGEYIDGGRNHFIVKAPADRPGTRDATGVDLGGVYEFNGVGLSKDAARQVAKHLLKFAARS